MNQVPDYRDQIKYCGYVIYQNPTGNKDILLKSKLWMCENTKLTKLLILKIDIKIKMKNSTVFHGRKVHFYKLLWWKRIIFIKNKVDNVFVHIKEE